MLSQQLQTNPPNTAAALLAVQSGSSHSAAGSSVSAGTSAVPVSVLAPPSLENGDDQA